MKAHILIIADGRSDTARSWIRNILSLGYRVSLVSTFPCHPPEGLEHILTLPVAFSRFSRKVTTGVPAPNQKKSRLKSMIRRYSGGFQTLRYFIGPLTLARYAMPLKNFIRQVQPDLVHALRIPYEGMLGAATPQGIPFLAATWGNDLTLHADGSFLMRRFTRRCLERADGLTSDTHRDVRLAQAWGLEADAPALVVPGCGGLDLDAIRKTSPTESDTFNIPGSGKWVINPRGLRPDSIHQDVFFAAIPKVLAQYPEAIFICPALAGKSHIESLVEKYGIRERVFLLPRLPRKPLWALMIKSQVFVSPSSHDGTPNTLLEAMALGCFPVAGDIESLREWIEPGINGLLVNPTDPEELADAILQALESAELRRRAAERNFAIIQNRADRAATLPEIDRFYSQFLS
ncbi:MAG: glycosyltransferase [Desulfobacterales bacterium]